MSTLFDKVFEARLDDEHRHEQPEGTAERTVNRLTNRELLYEISEALEEILAERIKAPEPQRDKPADTSDSELGRKESP